MQLFDVYPLYNIEPVRGEGCYVFDAEDTPYLDFYGGHAVISIGHTHPYYVKTLKKQLEKIAFYSNSVINDLQKKLAKKLGKLSNCDDYQLFLVNSGAEANENALKLASFHNGRTKIVALKHSFHGRTSAAVNVTDDAKIQAPINHTFEVDFVAINDIEAVQKSLAQNDVCAVIIEGIQGIGGIHVPNAGFLKQVQQLCETHNTILILDEIQSGYGRSGRFFAFQYTDIQPDIITMAKGMGNGFPIGGVLISQKFKAKYGLLGTTFGGNHLACAAAIAVLDVMKEEKLIQNAEKMGDYLIEKLKKLDRLREVRGQGLMVAAEFEFPVATMRKYLAFVEKVFVGSSHDANTIRLLPPLNIGKKEIDLLVESIKAGIKVMENEMAESNKV